MLLVVGDRGGSAPPSWTPLNLGATLVRWYFDSTHTTLSRVDTWTDETAGVNATEVAGSGPSATAQAGFTAPTFDGSGQFLKAGATYPATTATTIWGLFHTPAMAQYTGVVSKWYASASIHVGGYQAAGTLGKLYFHVGDTANPAVSNATVTDDDWHYFIAVYAAPALTLILDGVVQTDTGSFAGGVPNTADNIGLGAAVAPGGSPAAFAFFDGGLCDIGICDTALSGSDLSSLETYLAAKRTALNT